MRLMDCHVHVDDVRIYDDQAAETFGVESGDVKWSGATLDKHLDHIEKDNLDTVFAIFENPVVIHQLRSMVDDCEVYGFYFVHNPKTTRPEHLKTLHHEGVLQGLKIHPVVDNFALVEEDVAGVLSAARRYDIPVLYHSDDRVDTLHLTAPELQNKLVVENSDVTFIVGHGGAYANPRLVGESPAAQGYWEGTQASFSRRELVKEALKLTRENPNAYYDTSIVTNRIKAGIVSDFLNEFPETTSRVLIGTDFPVRFSSARSQVEALREAGLRNDLVAKIAQNRLNLEVGSK